jgi:hypothetical protein
MEYASVCDMIRMNHSIISYKGPYYDDDKIKIYMERNMDMTAKQTHMKILEIAIVLSSLKLPPYVLMEIFDWTMPFVYLYHRHLKEKIAMSVYHFKNPEK